MDFKLFSKQSVLSPQEQKQQKMLMILAGLVLTTLIVVYFGFFRSSSTDPTNGSIQDSGTNRIEEANRLRTEGIIKKMDFDGEFLNDSRFQALRIYGEWPLEIENKGRTNPFLSY